VIEIRVVFYFKKMKIKLKINRNFWNLNTIKGKSPVYYIFNLVLK